MDPKEDINVITRCCPREAVSQISQPHSTKQVESEQESRSENTSLPFDPVEDAVADSTQGQAPIVAETSPPSVGWNVVPNRADPIIKALFAEEDEVSITKGHEFYPLARFAARNNHFYEVVFNRKHHGRSEEKVHRYLPEIRKDSVVVTLTWMEDWPSEPGDIMLTKDAEYYQARKDELL